MPTTFVGMKELRQNMARISQRATKRRERVIVLRKNKPVFELRPLSAESALVETFRQSIEEARADVKAGRTRTLEEVEKRLGL
jgi:antitoxin (DNA-binding transcriptional repressor) of toxin-antitoxin stability system